MTWPRYFILILVLLSPIVCFAGENLVTSQVGGEEGALGFAFAIAEGLVIADVPVEIGQRKPKLRSRYPVFVASIPVDGSELPPHVRGLLGRSIRIYNREGSCETKITGFKVVSKEAPHQTAVKSWADKRAADDEVAEAVFASGNRHLVATVGHCGGDFAKDSKARKAEIFPGTPADSATKKQVQDAVRALPMYKKHIKPHERRIEEQITTVFKMKLLGKASTWVSTYIAAGDDCGEGGVLGALWKLEPSQQGRG